MDRLWQDVRDGLRMLRSSPGVSAVAIMMLALGIGGNAAMFSLANGVLLSPLPYADSDRLVRVEEHHAGSGSTALTDASYLDLKKGTQTLVDVSAYRW